ncbi:hypothetical protein BKA70DRAFT_1217796 [Coprinopsis sp. MPI-PUGE-AT-0042]|nr:hypothetical protein BKA70DRAFT_1217796 [Coprinopsis sp. MPI-PUGE-AT-0042]
MASRSRSSSCSSVSSSCSGASDYIVSFLNYGLDFRPRPLQSPSAPALPDHADQRGASRAPSRTQITSSRTVKHESTILIKEEDMLPWHANSTRPDPVRKDSEVWMPFGSPIQEEALPPVIPPDTGLSASPKNLSFQNTTFRHARPRLDSSKLLPLDSVNSSDRRDEAPQISSKRSSRQGKWWSRKGKGAKDPERLTPLDVQSQREGECDTLPASPISRAVRASLIQRYQSESSPTSAFFDDNQRDGEGGDGKSPESRFSGRGLYQSRSVSDLLNVPESHSDTRPPSKPRLSILTKPLRKPKSQTSGPLHASPLDISPWEQALSAEVEREAGASNWHSDGPAGQRQGATGLPLSSSRAHRRQTTPTINFHGSVSVIDLRSPTYEGLSPAGVPPSQGEQHRYHYTKSAPMSGTDEGVIGRPISSITKASSEGATTGNVPSRTGVIKSVAPEKGSGSGRSRESHEGRRSVDTTHTAVSNVFTKPRGTKKSRLAFVEKALLSMSGGAAHYVPDVAAGRKGPGAPSVSIAYAM